MCNNCTVAFKQAWKSEAFWVLSHSEVKNSLGAVSQSAAEYLFPEKVCTFW